MFRRLSRRPGSRSAAPAIEMVGATYEQLVAAAHLTRLNPAFGPEFGYWVNRGDRVRGELFLVRMRCEYTDADVLRMLETESRRRHKEVRPGTAYEQAYFATHGWNRSDHVVAFGSAFSYRPGLPLYVSVLNSVWDNWSESAEYLLSVCLKNVQWRDIDYVLCVVDH